MKLALILPLILIISLVGWLFTTTRPPSHPSADAVFVINQGDSLSQIANRLQQNNFIRHPTSFMISVYLSGKQKKIQSGSFNLSSAKTHKQIITTLTSGGSHDYWLRIPEGYRKEEVASLFPQNVPFAPQDFIDQSKEGYIFPDSYLIPQDYSLSQVFKVISQNFTQKLNQAQQSSTVDPSSALIIASLLEREAKNLDDKKIIAGIFSNRLSAGMPLQVDATVQYARDSLYPVDNYWLPPRKTDLKIDSAFNTYLHSGLPPAPICNPGLDSLQAAFHPQPNQYFYYISDTNGNIHYATTLEQHNQNISTYLQH